MRCENGLSSDKLGSFLASAPAGRYTILCSLPYLRFAGLDPAVIDSGEHPGVLSHFTCPECSGPLFEIRDGRFLRFRCRVGHAYTAENMLEKSEALENALYVALNPGDGRQAGRPREHGHAVARFEEQARESRQCPEGCR
jgi:two-component system chemotaxis response regulator CheB